jgi:hypothetical protein
MGVKRMYINLARDYTNMIDRETLILGAVCENFNNMQHTEI